MIISIVVVISLIAAGMSFMSGTFGSLPGAINDSEQHYDYVIYKSSVGLTCAKNGTNERVDYSSMNSSQVIQDCIDNSPTYSSFIIKDDVSIDTGITLKEGTNLKFQNITLLGDTPAIIANFVNYLTVDGVSITPIAGYSNYAIYLSDIRFSNIHVSRIVGDGGIAGSVGVRLQSNSPLYGSYYNIISVNTLSEFETGVLYYSALDGNVNANVLKDTEVSSCYNTVMLLNAIDGMAVSFNQFYDVYVAAPITVAGHSYGFTMSDLRPTGLRVINNQFVNCRVDDVPADHYGITLGERCDATWEGGFISPGLTVPVNIASLTNSTIEIHNCYGYNNEESGNATMLVGNHVIAIWFRHPLVATPNMVTITGTSNDTARIWVHEVNKLYIVVYSDTDVSANRSIYWHVEVQNGITC